MTTQYREVKRKAAVGERIKILSVHHARLYVGEELSVTLVDAQGDIWSVKERAFPGLIFYSSPTYGIEYVVLEPIAQPAAPTPLGTSFLSSDPLYAAFRQFVADNADELRKLLPEIVPPAPAPLFTVADGKLAPITPKPLNRAQVIAKATADVAELLDALAAGQGNSAGVTGVRGVQHLTVEFHVNRDKRAVTALVRGKITGKLYDKHTAKCSPADVFHAEIGKAIALRKALGLTVPTEYTDAPQPDEPRKGAKLSNGSVVYAWKPTHRTSGGGGGTVGLTFSQPDRGYTYLDGTGFEWWTPIAGNENVIDDTDVDYNAVSAKGVAA